jgi:hypothetical protein
MDRELREVFGLATSYAVERGLPFVPYGGGGGLSGPGQTFPGRQPAAGRQAVVKVRKKDATGGRRFGRGRA